MENNAAVVFGGTGLTGSLLLAQISNDQYFNKIIVVTRKEIATKNLKITNKVIDFSKEKEFENCIIKDAVVFSCIGTTQSQVQGNKKRYKEIDFDITLKIAKASKKMNADKFLFISSGGANSKSSNFYLKLKGEIEEAVINIKNNSLFIIKPSLLIGKRKNRRILEEIGQLVMPIFSFILPSTIKAINAKTVAKAMINLSKSNLSGKNIIENSDLFNWSKS